MAWVVLVASGMFETVCAVALAQTDGFRRVVPSVVFGVALVISMAGLAYALKTLPVGTAYAVWVGIGAVLTVTIAILRGDEPATLVRILLLLGIVACVIGLKVVA